MEVATLWGPDAGSWAVPGNARTSRSSGVLDRNYRKTLGWYPPCYTMAPHGSSADQPGTRAQEPVFAPPLPSSEPDPVAEALQCARVAWCSGADRKALRRTLLDLLRTLEDA